MIFSNARRALYFITKLSSILDHARRRPRDPKSFRTRDFNVPSHWPTLTTSETSKETVRRPLCGPKLAGELDGHANSRLVEFESPEVHAKVYCMMFTSLAVRLGYVNAVDVRQLPCDRPSQNFHRRFPRFTLSLSPSSVVRCYSIFSLATTLRLSIGLLFYFRPTRIRKVGRDIDWTVNFWSGLNHVRLRRNECPRKVVLPHRRPSPTTC